MWIGETRPDGYRPAFCFYFVEPSIIEAMKGVLTKALVETNTLQMFSDLPKSSKSSASSDADIDAQWLEAQLIADRADVHMEDLGDRDLDDFDIDQLNDELDYIDRYERETLRLEQLEETKERRPNAFDYDSDENEESRLDEELAPEFREGNNEETV
jgi:hypothetical protein